MKNPIELSDLKCKVHPESQIKGPIGWFEIESGKWVLDTNDIIWPLECNDSCRVLTYRVKIASMPDNDVAVRIVDETNWA